mmetsp:Transcript_61778/g.163756  ORF Transcript_61778/g.163756 Transcript_61778/m.163756 type:complete len:415 (-) Transcript_61778:211-1455(-)
MKIEVESGCGTNRMMAMHAASNVRDGRLVNSASGCERSLSRRPNSDMQTHPVKRRGWRTKQHPAVAARLARGIIQRAPRHDGRQAPAGRARAGRRLHAEALVGARGATHARHARGGSHAGHAAHARGGLVHAGRPTLAGWRDDRGADGLGSEKVDERAVGDAAVHDHGRANAAAHRVDRSAQLGYHAARRGAVVAEALRLARAQLGHELLVAVEHALHVGEQQQRLCAQRTGDDPRHRVRIDVVRRAALACRDGRDHGDDAIVEERVQREGAHALRRTHQAQVHLLLLARRRVGHNVALFRREHERVIFARDADGTPPRGVDGRGDLLVERAAEHHLDHLHRRRVRHAQPVHELRLDLQPLKHRTDLRAAAVHDHRPQAERLEHRHVAGKLCGALVVGHRVAAVLDHHHAATLR